MCARRWSRFWRRLSLASAVSAQADVFNMGGTNQRRDVDGPGKPAIRDRGRSGQRGGSGHRQSLRLGALHVPDGQVRRDGRPVLPVPQRRGDDERPLRLVQLAVWLTAACRPSASPKAAVRGSYSYSVTGSYSQAANCPIFDVTWGDAARFCNWLQNGSRPAARRAPARPRRGPTRLNGATTDAHLWRAVTAQTRAATYFIPSGKRMV